MLQAVWLQLAAVGQGGRGWISGKCPLVFKEDHSPVKLAPWFQYKSPPPIQDLSIGTISSFVGWGGSSRGTVLVWHAGNTEFEPQALHRPGVLEQAYYSSP